MVIEVIVEVSEKEEKKKRKKEKKEKKRAEDTPANGNEDAMVVDSEGAFDPPCLCAWYKLTSGIKNHK